MKVCLIFRDDKSIKILANCHQTLLTFCSFSFGLPFLTHKFVFLSF